MQHVDGSPKSADAGPRRDRAADAQSCDRRSHAHYFTGGAGGAARPGTIGSTRSASPDSTPDAGTAAVSAASTSEHTRGYWPRDVVDASGFALVMGNLTPWGPEASPQAIRASFDKPGLRLIPAHDQKLAAARRAGDGA